MGVAYSVQLHALCTLDVNMIIEIVKEQKKIIGLFLSCKGCIGQLVHHTHKFAN